MGGHIWGSRNEFALSLFCEARNLKSPYEKEVDTSPQMTALECIQASRRENDLPPVDRASANPHTKAIECLERMQRDQITSLVILENKKPIGIVRMQDLVAAGL